MEIVSLLFHANFVTFQLLFGKESPSDLQNQAGRNCHETCVLRLSNLTLDFRHCPNLFPSASHTATTLVFSVGNPQTQP